MARPAPALSALLRLSCLVAALGAAPLCVAATPRDPGDDGPAGEAGLAGRFAGRRLLDALVDLKGRGLDLIFSSDLVRPDLVIAVEPGPGTARQVLERILAPFGLEARDGPGHVLVIVRAAPQSAGPSRPVAARPAFRETLAVRAAPDGNGAPASGGARSFDHDDLQGLPVLAGDPARAVALLPGIAAGDRSAKFSARGAGPGESRLVLDGLDLETPFHLEDFAAAASVIDSGAIERLALVNGIVPVGYGDASGGVLDLSTLDFASGAHSVASLGTLNAGILTGGPLRGDGGSWLVSARTWRPDIAADTVALANDGIDPSFCDFLGKAQARLPGGSLLSVHLLASRDRLDYLSDPGDQRAGGTEDRRHAWVDLQTPWNAHLFSRTLLASGRLMRSREGEVLDASGGSATVDDARALDSVRLKQDWTFLAGERASLSWGFDVTHSEGESVYRGQVDRADPFAGGRVTIDRDIALEAQETMTAAYAGANLRLADPVTVELGVRLDHQDLTGESGTSPRVQVTWALDDRTVLTSGWGHFDLPPRLDDLAIEDGVLPPPRAQETELWQLEVRRRLGDRLMLGVAFYDADIRHPHPRYENLFDPAVLIPELAADRVAVVPDRARNRGVELDLEGGAGTRLSWRASYALASSEDGFGAAWVPRPWDQRHAATIVVGFRPAEAWDVSVAGFYHSGWPTTDVSARQVTLPDGSTAVQPILGERNASRLPDYGRVDLKLTRRFQVGEGRLDFYLQVTNLADRRNACCVEKFVYTPEPGGEVEVDRVYGTGLGRTPAAGLLWAF